MKATVAFFWTTISARLKSWHLSEPVEQLMREQLTARKLQSLTVVHNYLVPRDDGSTAAERFYGVRP